MSVMAAPKRPTTKGLDELACQLACAATEPETPNCSAQLALGLVEEIRRLRALIVAWEGDLSAPRLYLSASAQDLQSEARMIRDEAPPARVTP
jgi:hypothetical protein